MFNVLVYFDKSAILWHYWCKKTKFSEGFCDNNHMQKATMHLADNLESKSVKNATHNHTQPTWPDCGESDWKGKTVQCRFSSTLLAMLTDHSAAIGDDTPRAEQTELNCLWQDASSVEAVLIFMAGLHYGDLKPGEREGNKKKWEENAEDLATVAHNGRR